MALRWKCETIRLSLFSTDAIRLSGDDWKSLTGQDEAEQEQKGGGRHVFAGPLFGGQLNLGAAANRCDCILHPVTVADDVQEGYVPSVGEWPARLEEFFKATQQFLSRLSYPVTRMAFGAAVLSPFSNEMDANKGFISQIGSLKLDPDKMRDTQFRINHRTNSTADNELLLNRLTTWSVQQVQMQVVAQETSPAFVDTLSYVLRLEMDHNTDGRRTQPFDANRLVPIYSELTNLALQNAEKGEVS